MLEHFISLFTSPLFVSILSYIFKLTPLWLPFLLVLFWFEMWIEYKRREYIKAQGSTLLEIRIPREILKSPAAMELFIANLHQTGVGSIVDVYTKGRVRQWFSLELVSINGGVHFYIWTNPKSKNMIETQLYAQFPTIEIHEVPDYTLGVEWNPEKFKFGWFGQYALTKADAYPIKTYIDYGLDKDPKEEYKHDPIVPLIEYLGSLGQGEQVWIQILIQGHTKEGIKYGRLSLKPDWKDAAKNEIKEFIKKNAPKVDEGKEPKAGDLSKGNQDVVAAMERTLGKLAFDTMIRAGYIAEKDRFDGGRSGSLGGIFRSFSSETLNGFKGGWDTGTGIGLPWQDPRGKKKAKREAEILEAYKRRSFFNTPFKNYNGYPFILTTEELATLFHFPSADVAATPTLARIPSKKAEAPANLPI